MAELQYHIQLTEGDIGTYVLLPGDPARCEAIAQSFDSPRLVASNREFTTYTGTLDGVDVSVCSTGIGSASTAIAVEELIAVGATTCIRIGTCGGLVPHLKRGELIVMHSAVRAEGCSSQYVPIEFPAVANPVVTTALEAACRKKGATYLLGTTVSVDSLYSEIAPDTVPIGEEMVHAYRSWQDAGAVAAEMECGLLYPLAMVRRIRAGSLCVIVDEAADDAMPDHTMLPVDLLIDTAAEALRILIAYDSADRPGGLDSILGL